MKATTRLKNGFTSVVDDNRGHEVILDLPAANGGDDLGTMALELCLMSYSGCVHTIFNMLAKKMHIEFTSLDVEASGDKNIEENTFTNIDIKASIKSDASEVKIQKCFEQTLKSCPVGVLFHKAGVKTNYEIKKI